MSAPKVKPPGAGGRSGAGTHDEQLQRKQNPTGRLAWAQAGERQISSRFRLLSWSGTFRFVDPECDMEPAQAELANEVRS